MEMQDRRVRRTQKALAKALIALTIEKGYDAVSIRDITERAEVGYATFFRHYPDKDTLLHGVLDVVLAELTTLLSGPASLQAAQRDTVGIPLFYYVQEHSNIIRVLLSSQSSNSLVQHIIDITVQNTLTYNIPRMDSLVPAEIAAYHLINSSISLIKWWLEHDQPYAPERMGEIYHALIIDPTRAIAFTSDFNQENPSGLNSTEE